MLSDDICSQFGCSLGPSLLLDGQVMALARSAYEQLWLVLQLLPSLDKKNMTFVTHALVTSRIDYCKVLYEGRPLKTSQKQ